VGFAMLNCRRMDHVRERRRDEKKSKTEAIRVWERRPSFCKLLLIPPRLTLCVLLETINT